MKELISTGLESLGLSGSVPAQSAEQLAHYGQLLIEQNKVMNLTAITDPHDVATLHMLDCAPLLECGRMHGKTLIDVGTGAGFPGMPLQILEPTAKLTLLDSLNKRIGFLQEVCDALNLKHTRCVHGRAEEYARDHREKFDYATSRAVAALNVLCELALPMVKVGGAFLAMKSVDCDEELRQAKSAIAQLGGTVESVRDYTIPGTDIRHRLITIRKVKSSPASFPRAFARIKKNPLI